MYKAVGIWSWPRDDERAEFDAHYWQTHVPAARKLPGVQRITVLEAAEDAREPDIYKVAEVYWETDKSFADAAESAEWDAMVADAGGMMERFGVTLSSAHGWEKSGD